MAALGFLMLFVRMQLGDKAVGAYLPGGMVFRLAGIVSGYQITLPLVLMGVTAVLTALFTILALNRLNSVEF